MDIDDAEAVALLVILWRKRQRPDDADTQQYAGCTCQPGNPAATDRVKPGRRTPLVEPAPETIAKAVRCTCCHAHL